MKIYMLCDQIQFHSLVDQLPLPYRIFWILVNVINHTRSIRVTHVILNIIRLMLCRLRCTRYVLCVCQSIGPWNCYYVHIYMVSCAIKPGANTAPTAARQLWHPLMSTPPLLTSRRRWLVSMVSFSCLALIPWFLDGFLLPPISPLHSCIPISLQYLPLPSFPISI